MDSPAHAISWKELRSLSQNYHAPQEFENFALVPLTSTVRLRQISLSLHNHAPRDWNFWYRNNEGSKNESPKTVTKESRKEVETFKFIFGLFRIYYVVFGSYLVTWCLKTVKNEYLSHHSPQGFDRFDIASLPRGRGTLKNCDIASVPSGRGTEKFRYRSNTTRHRKCENFPFQ